MATPDFVNPEGSDLITFGSAGVVCSGCTESPAGTNATTTQTATSIGGTNTTANVTNASVSTDAAGPLVTQSSNDTTDDAKSTNSAASLLTLPPPPPMVSPPPLPEEMQLSGMGRTQSMEL